MADVTLTGSGVVAGAGAVVIEGTAGETITQGKAVYLLASTNEYMIADCTDADKDAVIGFATTASIDGGPIKVLSEGDMTTASELTAGTVYILSASGAICPAADFSVATDALTVVGAASSATNLKVKPIVTSYGITG